MAGNDRPTPRVLSDGRYDVDALIATGRWGAVYRGRDMRSGAVVALKRYSASPPHDALTSASSGHAYAAQRLLIGRLRHPQLVAVHDAFAERGGCWVVMDYVAGGDLRSRLDGGRMAWPRVVRLAHQVCAGLAHAAAGGVLHRDLKPGNLLVDEAGRVRVTDFWPPIDGVVDHAGTPAYFAPERLRHASATVATDIYALGVVCYEWLTGCRPHAGDTVSALARAVFAGRVPAPSRHTDADVPARLDAVVLQALAGDPVRRHASWASFAAALDRCLEPVSANGGGGGAGTD